MIYYPRRCRGTHKKGFAWAGPMLLCMVFTLFGQRFSQSFDHWVFVRTEFEAGAWWQLFSAQWVHLNPMHAVFNIGALAVIALIFDGWVSRASQFMAWLGGFLGVAVVLAIDSKCAYYAGASGALHGYWAGAALTMCFGLDRDDSSHSSHCYFGWILLLCLTLKLVQPYYLEHVARNGSILIFMTEATYVKDTFPVYHLAHAAGTVGGTLSVLLWLLFNTLAHRYRSA